MKRVWPCRVILTTVTSALVYLSVDLFLPVEHYGSPQRRCLLLPFFFTISLLAFGQPEVERQPWPQWGGAQRNFAVPSADLADSWPPEGPRRLWKRALGDGYSGIAVVGKRLYTMYRKDDREFFVALDCKTGKTLWEHSYATPSLPGPI